MSPDSFIGRACTWLCGVGVVASIGCGAIGNKVVDTGPTNLQRAKVHLAAADYRRAIEACQQEVSEHPSAKSYLYLTYVYQALDAYLDALARTDRWVVIEQLALSLSPGRPEELMDSPDILARIAKELIQNSTRKQSDVVSAMAARLDAEMVANLWALQKQWRKNKPDGWWFGVPVEWNW